MRRVIAVLAMLGLAGCDLATAWMIEAPVRLAGGLASAGEKKEPVPVVKHPGANCRAPNGSEFKTKGPEVCKGFGVWIGE